MALVFRELIQPGTNFKDVLRKAIDETDVLGRVP